MSQCQVAACRGVASAISGACTICSTPIECTTPACRAVAGNVIALGSHWCSRCDKPATNRVPTQATAQALRVKGVDWQGAQAQAFMGNFIATPFGAHTLKGGDVFKLLDLHLNMVGRKRVSRIVTACIAQHGWPVTDITRAGTG